MPESSFMAAGQNDFPVPHRETPVKSADDVADHLKGLRVLVVEDEFFVRILLEDDLRAAGCIVVGPCSDLGCAMRALAGEAFDVAVLDVNLNGEMVYPLADELSRRGTPFLFLSGYGCRDFPERFRDAMRLAKPHEPAALIRDIRLLAEASRNTAAPPPSSYA